MSFLVLIVGGGALGALVLRRIDTGGPEGFAYRMYVGLSLCAVLILVLGSVSLQAAQLAMFALAGAGIVYEGWHLSRGRHAKRVPLPASDPVSRFEIACLGVIVLANGLAAISALAPITGWDAGVAHLALPSDYAREGRIQVLESNAYSAFPHLLHSLYAVAFFQGGETAVALFNWVYGPLACMAIFSLGKRVEGRRCGLIAAAILATSPVYFDQVGTVSIDMPYVGMTLAALACLMAWRDEKRLSWLVLGAFLAGSSSGIRHTGFLVCVFLTLAVLVTSRDERVRMTLVFGGVSVLAASPWFLRSALLAGNPVYPFFMNTFTGGTLPIVAITGIGAHESIKGTGLGDFLMFPWNIVMRPHWYDGWSNSPGGLVLFLGIPGLFVGGRRARMLGVFSISGGMFFFFFRHFARYLLPFFAPMMVVAAVAACRVRKLRRPIALLLLLTFVYGLGIGAATVHFKVPVALGFETREAYLTRRLERFAAFEWVNENVPATATIMTFDPRSYYIAGPTYQNFEMLKQLSTMSHEGQLAWLKERNIRYLLYPNAYIDESPGYESTGFRAHLDGWRQDARHFRLIKRLDIPRARSGGMERVEIYEIHHDVPIPRPGVPTVREKPEDVEP